MKSPTDRQRRVNRRDWGEGIDNDDNEEDIERFGDIERVSGIGTYRAGPLATHLPFHKRWKKWLKPPETITYQMSFWALLVIIATLATIERFTLNLMPFGQLPDEKMAEAKEKGKYAVYAFHVVERISARVMLVQVAFFFVSVCRVLQNSLSEWIARRRISWISFDDWAHASYRSHRRLGLYTFILIVVMHVGGAFLPLLDGLTLDVNSWTFYPLFLPHVRKVKFPAIPGKWSMRFDDFYQGVIGLILALLLQPLTIVWYRMRTHYYNLLQGLHLTGAIRMFFLYCRYHCDG